MDLATVEAKNIFFVQLIEQEACLYDKSHPDFTRRDITESAWEKISQQVKEPVKVCKERWRNLRTVYVRNLHAQYRSGISKVKKRKYYLHDAMQFMDPYIKSLKHRSSYFSNLHQHDAEGQEHHISSIEEQEDQKGHFSHAFESQINDTIESSMQGIREPEPGHGNTVGLNGAKRWLNSERLQDVTPDPVDTCFMEYGHDATALRPLDPDEEFLHSLLPEVKSMGRKQKRRFKIEVLQLIDKIIDEDEG